MRRHLYQVFAPVRRAGLSFFRSGRRPARLPARTGWRSGAMGNEGGDEDCRRGGPREPDESELERGRLRRELIERALAHFPRPEPHPSKEEVESVFRSVTASY